MLQPERQFDAEKMRASFDFHREHPDISFESHIREKRIALGDSISSLDPIYLDTRFWIFIRDAALGSPKQAAHVDLLSVLRSAVQSKKAFCPLSGASYIELLRQAEPEKRNAIASLVDELSLGITFAAEEERAIAELANFLYSPIFPSQLHPLRSLIWNRLPYVLGVMSPSFEWLVPAETLVAKKAFFDHLWDFSLADMVSAIQPGNPLTQLPLEELAIRLNALNQKYSGELKSYKQTYKREVWGAIQPLIPHAKEIGDAILDQMAARGLGKSDRASPSEIERKFKDSLLEVAEKSTLSKILPTLHITAHCHASIRWDKKRRLKANDTFDFEHATAAIAYCKIFLTEAPLKTLLTANHVALDREFGCSVISDEEEAVNHLRSIYSR